MSNSSVSVRLSIGGLKRQTIDDSIAEFPPEVQGILQKVQGIVRKVGLLKLKKSERSHAHIALDGMLICTAPGFLDMRGGYQDSAPTSFVDPDGTVR